MKNKLLILIFRALITLGIISFLCLFLWSVSLYLNCEKENLYKILPSTAILLSSLIASFAVIRTILNTQQIELEKKENEKKKNKVILIAGLKLFNEMIDDQETYFKELSQEINKSQDVDLKEIDLIKYFYDNETNENIIIKNIDYLLNIELHKYTSERLVFDLLNIKNTAYELIHLSKILKNTHIANNDKSSSLRIINYILAELAKSKDMIEKHNKMKEYFN
ncbi:MAG: hypothetical protein C0626_00115 [Arcobacter sp.]|nr:MAG: hypothetical protein C0626_00115 [Arcobacter sp.]